MRRVPVIRRKVAEVLEGAGFSPDSHDGRDLLQILETYPRDELFQTPVDELAFDRHQRALPPGAPAAAAYLRQDEYGRYYSALVYLPRDRYTTGVRLRLVDILKEELGGTSVDFTAWNTESILSRLHFVVRVARGAELAELTDADADRIEARLVEAARSWADGVRRGAERRVRRGARRRAAAPVRATPSPRATRPTTRRAPPSPTSRTWRRCAEAEKDFALSLYEPVGAGPGERRFKIYRTGRAGLPLGRPAGAPAARRRGRRRAALRAALRGPHPRLDLRLRPAMPPRAAGPGADIGDDARERFQEAFAAVWTGAAENDGFNSLVLRAGLDWRQAMVLRAYAKYLRQAGSTFSQDYMEDTLRTQRPHHPAAGLTSSRRGCRPAASAPARELIDGDAGGAGRGAGPGRLAWTRTASCGPSSPSSRPRCGPTSSSTTPTASRTRYVSMKFDPQAIPDLPAPRPAYEIWVYSPRVEGVHLRFGKVARGGLRWSDRREDFRTEVLGLVKAQMVKNTVIVPVGAKGGFVAKQLPDPAADRDAWLAEGIASYKIFISALLDITDNMVARRGRAAADVVRHDGDDTYLVVAADKGTASFSDIANEVAVAYDFWLGDAFASGGSRRLRPQGHGHHRPRRLGVRRAALPRTRPRHPDPGLHGRRRR